jgi:hypothetical protein
VCLFAGLVLGRDGEDGIVHAEMMDFKDAIFMRISARGGKLIVRAEGLNPCHP